MDLKVSVVLVDPELLSLKASLDEMGIGSSAIHVFQTDLEALQTMYIKGRPDLLILDLDLPGVIGVETVKAMRQQSELATLPTVVICSGETGAGELAATRTVCLVKPVLTGAWKDAVTRSLSKEAVDAPVTEQSKPDSRRAARKAFEAPCVVSTNTKKMKGVIKNISATGARVAVEMSFPVPSVVILIFAASVEPLKIMQMKARLVRQTKDGYGIQFLEMDGTTRFFINKLTGQQSL